MQSVRWVVEAPLRGDLADVDHAFDALGDLKEGSEFREANDRAFDLYAGQQITCGLGPRVSESLLQSERDAPLRNCDTQDDGFDRLTLFHNVGSFADLLAPCHLRDVNQSLHARLQLNKGSKISRPRDDASNALAHRVLARHRVPRMRLKLLHSQRNALLFRIDLDNFGFDLLLGRRTYDDWADIWPKVKGGPFA